jgi:UDP-N-acetylmuramyl tripeptide synthase
VRDRRAAVSASRAPPRHNVANALAAAALAAGLGLPDAAVVAGLRSFGASAGDNPGRADIAEVDGVRVFLDFAHNPRRHPQPGRAC